LGKFTTRISWQSLWHRVCKHDADVPHGNTNISNGNAHVSHNVDQDKHTDEAEETK